MKATNSPRVQQLPVNNVKMDDVLISLSSSSKVFKGTKRSAFSIPTGSKNSVEQVINIDTNVDISTVHSKKGLTFLLPRFNICIIIISIIFCMVAISEIQEQIIELNKNIILVKNEMELAYKNYDELKLNLEELTRRFDDFPANKHMKHLRCLVEREAISTVNYDEVKMSSVNSPRISMIEDSVGVSQVPLNEPRKNDKSQSIVPMNKKIQLPSVEESKLDVLSLSDDPMDIVVRKENIRSINGAEIANKSSDLVNTSLGETNNQSGEVFHSNETNLQNVYYPSYETEDTASSDYGRNPRMSRAKRSSTRDILAAHYIGAKPDITVRDGGLVAPWFLDDGAAEPFGLSNSSINLREGMGVVELRDAGLYYIYAQVYYLTSERTNSFWIKLRHKDKSDSSIAACSVNAAINITGDSTEVTCFTSAVRYLHVGEQVYLQQQERDRLVLMKEGQTFLGLVRLRSEKSMLKL